MLSHSIERLGGYFVGRVSQFYGTCQIWVSQNNLLGVQVSLFFFFNYMSGKGINIIIFNFNLCLTMLVLEILKAIGYPLVVFTNQALLFLFFSKKLKFY